MWKDWPTYDISKYLIIMHWCRKLTECVPYSDVIKQNIEIKYEVNMNCLNLGKLLKNTINSLCISMSGVQVGASVTVNLYYKLD